MEVGWLDRLRPARTVTRIIEWGEWRQLLLDGFAGVTHSPGGTAYATFKDFPLDTFPVSGKTGTAEVGDDENQRRDNSLFVAYGPNPDPSLVVSVMIESGGFGSESAAPATYMILEPIATGEIVQDQPGGFIVPRRGSIDAESVDERMVERHLYTAGLPDPDLLIRTAGEMRVSNYLLWQISYAELFVTDVYWPEFAERDLHEAVRSYASRRRRFGGLDRPEAGSPAGG